MTAGTVEHSGKTFPVDSEGFLADASLWCPEWVDHVRGIEEIDEITEEHEEVLERLRAYFAEHGRPPRVRDTTLVTGYKLKTIYELFPSGPGKGACKMAGLPKPDGCT
ncbi:MAG: TusE/DsrC/DsvC family sulfur relay protein [Deltaproteobacteria bacterium]|jgi:tRNA 2-thiouridine synthesizing protein E|nr:TusE/DsrC/DsvC family sulfur relay protein [Deltaproteobacteria bacterium]